MIPLSWRLDLEVCYHPASEFSFLESDGKVDIGIPEGMTAGELMEKINDAAGYEMARPVEEKKVEPKKRKEFVPFVLRGR